MKEGTFLRLCAEFHRPALTSVCVAKKNTNAFSKALYSRGSEAEREEGEVEVRYKRVANFVMKLFVSSNQSNHVKHFFSPFAAALCSFFKPLSRGNLGTILARTKLTWKGGLDQPLGY